MEKLIAVGLLALLILPVLGGIARMRRLPRKMPEAYDPDTLGKERKQPPLP